MPLAGPTSGGRPGGEGGQNPAASQNRIDLRLQKTGSTAWLNEFCKPNPVQEGYLRHFAEQKIIQPRWLRHFSEQNMMQADYLNHFLERDLVEAGCLNHFSEPRIVKEGCLHGFREQKVMQTGFVAVRGGLVNHTGTREIARFNQEPLRSPSRTGGPLPASDGSRSEL